MFLSGQKRQYLNAECSRGVQRELLQQIRLDTHFCTRMWFGKWN